MSEELRSRYLHFRRISKEYLSYLPSKRDDPDFDLRKVGKLLDIYHNGKMIFESENELSIMMDFAITESLFNGKSLVERELESAKDLDNDHRLILEAFRSSYTSLFEVIVNNASASTVKLYDTLNNSEEEIVDVNFSRTVNPGLLLFCRIVRIQDFAMTSGAVFIFRGQLRDVLVRRYRSGLKSRFAINESVTRFILFHGLNREFGEALELI